MTTDQAFGAALEAAKNGKAISRIGWNGKNMIVFLNEGATDRSSGDQSHFDGIPGRLLHTGDKGINTRLPNLNMRSASGSTVTGWLASQTDLLAEDWCIHD